MVNRFMAVTRLRAVLVGLLLLGGGVVLVSVVLRDDPGLQVGSVPVERVQPDPTTPLASPGVREVAALDSVEGTLRQEGNDPEGFKVGSVELDFGPGVWVLTAGPSEDFDGDSRREPLLDELIGLAGRPAQVAVRLDLDDNDADVYLINGLTYRDPAGGPVPWRPTPVRGDPASPQSIAATARAEVGPQAQLDDLERIRIGRVEWQASVEAADGREFLVLLDRTGTVLLVRADD